MSSVYIVRCGDYYKVGKADNVEHRVKQLQTGNASRLDVVWTVETGNAFALENYLHKQYADKRAVGEWFALTEDDIKSIQETCNTLPHTSPMYTMCHNAVIEEQRNITKECNGNVLPAYLYNYYISICQIPSWDLTNDTMVAKQLGVSVRKIADTRRLLTKLGWIRFDTHTHRGTSYGMWYIGKEVVATKVGLETPLEDYVAVGIVTEEEYQAAMQQLEDEEHSAASTEGGSTDTPTQSGAHAV